MLFEWPWNLSIIKNVQNGARGWRWWNHEEEEDGRCFLKNLGIFFFFEQTRNFVSWTTDLLVEQLVNCYWFVWLVVSFCVICLFCFFMELIDCFFAFYCLISLLVGQPQLWELPTEIYLYNQIVFLLDDKLFYNQSFNWFVFIFLIVPIV